MNNSNKTHTPGPYTVDVALEPNTARIQNSKGVGVALTDSQHMKLFAAAPELLEALEGARDTLKRAVKLANDAGYDGTANSYEIQVEEIEALLSKARGES